MTNNPMIRLNDGAEMPTIGFGVLFSSGNETVEMVKTAIGAGYRLIDTAAAYRNEEQVGEAIRQSGIDRSELFVTTKLFLADYGYDEAMRGFDSSMEKLGLDYLDLYLLHWPVPRNFDATLASWRALEDLQAAGHIRSIGVCNFNPDHLDNLIAQTGWE
ncbi:aldo/keto reductase [Paracoccus angustae]|uniref:Aldo/keto reductase n=2 Tax=Paracoccus angustae TaxID=1671480 RepID=A0ABV7TYP9_9RHOB